MAHRYLFIGLATFTAAVALSQPAVAQTAAARYERAQERETEALAGTSPSAEALRAIAQAYESIVRRYPVSGYADNALWQAAGLLERVFAITGVDADRQTALRYLNWLQKEYPQSSLVRQVAARVSALSTPALPAAPKSPAPPATKPAVAASPESPKATNEHATTIRAISSNPLPNGDRLTIELTGEAPYRGERVADPDRIFFDFTNTTSATALASRIRSIQTPLIKTVRVGSPSRGVTRVVLELTGTPRFSSFPLYEPFRLVVDIENTATAGASSPAAPSMLPAPPQTTETRSSTNASESAAAVPVSAPSGPAPVVALPQPKAATPGPTTAPAPSPAPPSSNRNGDYSLSRQLGLRVARIVIDPGHGGHDPGAQSNGVTEADLVLDVALRLEKLLGAQPGVEVVLTRRTNEFIPLEERTAIANREKADLFLSIHANAHRQSAVRGVETYFLNFAMNEEAEAVAARENATSGQTMGTLPTIVKAIALNDKLTESRELASLVQTTLVRKLRSQSSAIRDLGVKQAPFVVLIGAQMPSVLTEIAFLTNRPEAGLLKQPAYRQQIAQALKDGVVKYQQSLKKITTVAARDPQQ